jgi:DNA modification methylase
MNRLLFGDNLKWLRDTRIFPDASVDLVYLDPPFNSNADYNVLFREASGEASQAQFHAFTDTWNWADAAQTYAEFVDDCPNTAVVEMMDALHDFLRNSPMMAYLAMMAPRLVELHRVLKPTGSLYLHCDPTASHYLKLVLDGVFGKENFRSEISWKRSSAHNDAKQGRKQPGNIRDIIFFYTKSNCWTWNWIYTPYTSDYLKREYRHKSKEDGRHFKETDPTANKPGGDVSFEWRVKRQCEKRPEDVGIKSKKRRPISRWMADLNDEYKSPKEDWEYLGVFPYKGRYWAYSKQKLIGFAKAGKLRHRKTGMPRIIQYADEMPGIPLQNDWQDITPALGDEDLGYDTQKPVALLERMILSSSNEGDVVLDSFCGCGTAIHAAQKLGRQWIGIDVTYLAINLIKRRLKDAFGKDVQFEERGQPTDFGSAKELAGLDKWQFQQWALSLIDARPRTAGEGKGADRGVDGMLYFYETRDKREKILVQVKGGGVQRNDVSTLLGDVNNQKFIGGILITLEKPTKPMREEAADAGRYTSKLWHKKDYPKIQILTIEGLLDGTERVEAPPQDNPFAKAQREAKPEKQPEML